MKNLFYVVLFLMLLFFVKAVIEVPRIRRDMINEREQLERIDQRKSDKLEEEAVAKQAGQAGRPEHKSITYEEGIMESIDSEIFELVKDQLGVTEVKLESRFIEDLNGDSLDSVELVMEVEKKFSIDVNDEECEQIRTVSDLIEIVKKKKENEPALPKV